MRDLRDKIIERLQSHGLLHDWLLSLGEPWVDLAFDKRRGEEAWQIVVDTLLEWAVTGEGWELLKGWLLGWHREWLKEIGQEMMEEGWGRGR